MHFGIHTDPFINKVRFPLKETNGKLRIQRKMSEFRDIGHTQIARKGQTGKL